MHGEIRCSTRKGFLMFTSKPWTDRNVRWLHFKAPTQCLSSKTRAIRVCCIRLMCTKCSRVHCGEASKSDDLRHPESPLEATWCPKRMRRGCFITGFVWQTLYMYIIWLKTTRYREKVNWERNKLYCCILDHILLFWFVLQCGCLLAPSFLVNEMQFLDGRPFRTLS